MKPTQPFRQVVSMIETSNIQYPFIVKPDVGAKGIMFRKIENVEQLQAYHRNMPATYLVQEYLPHPYEISVFYIRMPNEEKGRITGIIKKILPEVVGDGTSTVLQLMDRHPGACDQLNKLRQQHKAHLQTVLATGEKLVLSEIANLYNGAKFTNHTHLRNDNMLAVFDEISHKCKFFYGRYDIRCSKLKDLETGNFKVLEFNGAGSVANHIFTGTYSLLEAYNEILRHWKALYQVSMYNHRHGFKHDGFLQGLLFFIEVKKHFYKLKKADKRLIFPPTQAVSQPADVEYMYGRVE
jgi:hypothetical protein